MALPDREVAAAARIALRNGGEITAEHIDFASATGVVDRAAGQVLETLLGLDTIGATIRRATITGQGRSASVQIELAGGDVNGEILEFDELREMANATILKAALACVGALPALKAADALKAVALVRDVVRRQRTMTADDHARDWGEAYLQAARERDVDMSDQAERWEAFSDLRSIDQARSEDGGRSTIVLLDRDGSRFVRTGHFFPWVRQQEPGMSEGRITQRMVRVGWMKRNASGRIKASCPGFNMALGWAFLIVPPDWSGSEVPAGVDLMRAREGDQLSRVEVGTGRNLGTDEGQAA